MTKAEVALRWPDAVAIAKQFRDVFGDDTKLTYAKNLDGETLGKSAWPPSTNENMSALDSSI